MALVHHPLRFIVTSVLKPSSAMLPMRSLHVSGRRLAPEVQRSTSLPEPVLTSTIARPTTKPIKPRARSVTSREAVLKLAPSAVEKLKQMLSEPDPRLIRVGTKQRGCAGMVYHLEYVEKPDKFDEIVEQDGVRVLVDSKALFSIIGSEMEWIEDRMSARFRFNNPNVVDSCGCGESFNIA